MSEKVLSVVDTAPIDKLNKSPVESIFASEFNCEAKVIFKMLFSHLFYKFCHFKPAKICPM